MKSTPFSRRGVVNPAARHVALSRQRIPFTSIKVAVYQVATLFDGSECKIPLHQPVVWLLSCPESDLLAFAAGSPVIYESAVTQLDAGFFGPRALHTRFAFTVVKELASRIERAGVAATAKAVWLRQWLAAIVGPAVRMRLRGRLPFRASAAGRSGWRCCCTGRDTLVLTRGRSDRVGDPLVEVHGDLAPQCRRKLPDQFDSASGEFP